MNNDFLFVCSSRLRNKNKVEHSSRESYSIKCLLSEIFKLLSRTKVFSLFRKIELKIRQTCLQSRRNYGKILDKHIVNDRVPKSSKFILNNTLSQQLQKETNKFNCARVGCVCACACACVRVKPLSQARETPRSTKLFRGPRVTGLRYFCYLTSHMPIKFNHEICL